MVLPRDLGQALDGGLGCRQQPGHIGARTLQQRLGAVVLLEHGHEHVHGLDVGVVVAQRNALCIAQGFLELGGEFVETHVDVLRIALHLGQIFRNFKTTPQRRPCARSIFAQAP
ncbi:hypothetical protein D3C72_1974870 [compost metagenome]